MVDLSEQQAVPVARESGMDRAKARRAAKDASGELYVDHSIFVGIEACLTRNGKTVAHVVKYADAVEIADAVARLTPIEGVAASANDIERQDAQIAMGMIVDAATLDEEQSIAAAFLEGAQ